MPGDELPAAGAPEQEDGGARSQVSYFPGFFVMRFADSLYTENIKVHIKNHIL